MRASPERGWGREDLLALVTKVVLVNMAVLVDLEAGWEEASSDSPLLTLSFQVLKDLLVFFELSNIIPTLSDAGGAGDGGRQEKVPQCQTVSSLVDKPQDPQGGWKEQSEWDLLCNNDTLIREPSEYDIWRDILVQQKPVAGGSEGMKTSRTWTQA